MLAMLHQEPQQRQGDTSRQLFTMQQTLNTSVLFPQPNTVHRGDESNEFHSQNKASQACYQYLEFPLLFLPPVSQWILVCIYFSVSLEISQTFSFWIPEGKVGSSSENRLLFPLMLWGGLVLTCIAQDRVLPRAVWEQSKTFKNDPVWLPGLETQGAEWRRLGSAAGNKAAPFYKLIFTLWSSLS